MARKWDQYGNVEDARKREAERITEELQRHIKSCKEGCAVTVCGCYELAGRLCAEGRQIAQILEEHDDWTIHGDESEADREPTQEDLWILKAPTGQGWALRKDQVEAAWAQVQQKLELCPDGLYRVRSLGATAA